MRALFLNVLLKSAEKFLVAILSGYTSYEIE